MFIVKKYRIQKSASIINVLGTKTTNIVYNYIIYKYFLVGKYKQFFEFTFCLVPCKGRCHSRMVDRLLRFAPK